MYACLLSEIGSKVANEPSNGGRGGTSCCCPPGATSWSHLLDSITTSMFTCTCVARAVVGMLN